MDINPIPYKAFIGEDDSIQKLIDLLETLQKKYLSVLKTVSQDANTVKTAVQANTVATEEGREAVSRAAEATSRLSKLQNELKAAVSTTGVELARAKVKLAEVNKENTLFVKMTESTKTSVQAMKNELKVLVDTWEKMTTAERLNSEVSGGLIQRILQLKTSIAEATATIKISTSAKLEERKAVSDLDKAVARLVRAYSDETAEIMKVKRETDEVIKIRRLEVQANDNTANSYNKLAAQYELNKINLNKYSQEQINQSRFLKAQQEESAKMRLEMVRLQEATGNHALSVGNYTKAWNGLGNATQQVLRELPVLAVSAQTFFLAISNNVPILADEIANLTRQNKLAAAQGLETTSVWKQLGKSLFSWQTLLVLGVTALSLFGGKIVEWIGDLFQGDNALKSITKSYSEFLKTIKEGNNEYTRALENLTKMSNIFKNIDGTYLTAEDALAEYNKTLGESLGTAEDLNTANQNLIDKGPAYLEVMFQMALANAYLTDMSNQAAIAAANRANTEILWHQRLLERLFGDQREITVFMSRQEIEDRILGKREDAALKAEERGKALGQAYADAIAEGYQMAADAGIDLFPGSDASKTPKGPKGPSTLSVENENIKIRKQYLESLRELERDSLEKQRKQLVDAHNIQIQELRNKQKNDERLTKESRDLIDEIMKNSYQKLQYDLEVLDIEHQQRQLNTEKETLDLRLSLMEQGTAEYYATRAEILRNQMRYELLENKKLIETQRQEESAIRAKYDQDILRNEIALDDLLFEQQQKYQQSEFDLIRRSEYEKTKFRLEQERDRQQRVLELAKSGLLELSKLEIETVKNTLEAIDRALKENENRRDIFDLVGLRMDNETKDAAKQAVSFIHEQIASILDAEVQLAEIKVSKAQEQVSKAEELLRYEMEARNQGYAHFVETARAELAEAKKKEAEALKQKEQAQKAQERLNTLAQTSSLVTASANIWSSFSALGPFGIGAAVAAIATMFGSFIAAKARAGQVVAAQNEQYSEGHVELLEGGSHASGKDISLGVTKDGKNRRAEGGELFAVVNKRSTQKYGSKQLFDVINSINKGVFEDKYANIFNPTIVRAEGSNLDLLGLDANVAAIRKNSDYKYYRDSDGLLIERYKNRTRTFLRR